jgi:hypothetical protein
MTLNLPTDRLAAFIGDWTDVQRFLLAMTPRYGPHRISRAVVDAIAALDFPQYAVLATAVGHALFELRWASKYRDLTDTEMRVQSAACRLWDAIKLTDKELKKPPHCAK